jgi:predicted metallopeptidase
MPIRKPGKISYELAPDIKARFADIIHTLALGHVDLERVVCLRSRGSSARRVVARCHGMGKVLQVALNIRPVYVLEFLSERFDRLDEAGRDEVIIHELLHIPKNFGGGFRHHDVVTDKTVRLIHERYRRLKARASISAR